MPVEVWYIIALIVIIGVTFILLKRPLYECMFYGYVLMVILTGKIDSFFSYISKTSTDTLFYSIIAFLVLSKILDITKSIDSVIKILVAIFGRIRGGAAYVAVMGSTFMGALSGSGAGNVATTGVFTIPAMKKAGLPAHLAANIESSSSTMGNMIPPSGIILTALACFNEFSGQEMSQSVFWFACWGVALWFILQRLITVFIFCRYYRVEKMPKEQIPCFRDVIKEGWKNLLLPLIIILPFVIDSLFKSTLLTDRLGSGASNLSSCLLLFTPGLAAVYSLLVNRKKTNIKQIIDNMGNSVSSIVSIGATIFFAYCISNLFVDTNIGIAIGEYIQGFNLSIVAFAFLIPLFTMLLGMVLPGSAQTKIFGTTIISVFASAGGNPLLIAVMLPVITGAMEGITPPLALCTYTAMGIAESDMKSTLLNSFVWVLLHYLLSVLVLLGVLPVLGV